MYWIHFYKKNPTISSLWNLTVFLLQTLLLCITMLIRDPPSALASAFRFRSIPNNVGIDLYEDDLLHNFVTRDSQLMNGAIPWRGSRKKDPLFLQMLIEACTKDWWYCGGLHCGYKWFIFTQFHDFHSKLLIIHSFDLNVMLFWLCRGFHSCLPKGRKRLRIFSRLCCSC